MKILYVSHLSTNIAAGMNWSVPASIKAQEKIDDVLWINATDVIMPHWKETRAYRNLKDLGGVLRLSFLPKPYDKPDVVVFEGIYFKEYLSFSKELREMHIPYVIVPRGSMTYQAMHNHAWLKKWIAHKIWFDSFINHSWRIQYLTQHEADDSAKLFKMPYFIVPNGFNTPSVIKKSFCSEGIKAIFIGRLDIYHKGLDLLFDAITEMHTELHNAGFFLNIYGPHKYDYEKIKNKIEKRGLNDIVSANDEISGKEKERAIINSDIFIMTSRFEGHPMGLIEALSYGLPCLVTPGTNMQEEIRESGAGWTCEGNVESIKCCLRQAITGKGEYHQKSENARQLATRYDWNDLALRIHEEFEKLRNGGTGTEVNPESWTQLKGSR